MKKITILSLLICLLASSCKNYYYQPCPAYGKVETKKP